MIKKRMKKLLSPKHRQQGFTLVELMITLVLALLISYGIAQVLISSNRSSVTSDGLSQAQETGRFALSYLAEYIRKAGQDSLSDDRITTRPFADDALESANGTGDRLVIRYVPEAPVAPDTIQTCSGDNTGFTGIEIIEHRFWVNNDSLMCQSFAVNIDGSTGAALAAQQAIASGIEAMHVLYGYADDELSDSGGQRNVSRYINLNDLPPAAVPANKEWHKVYAIRIALMTRSLNDFTTEQRQQRYVLLDSDQYNFNDSVSRQVFNTTYIIENFN